MGRFITFQKVFVITGFYDVPDKYFEIEYLRFVMGIPGTDSSGIFAESDSEYRNQKENPACTVHAEFYFCNFIVRYCKDFPFRYRSCESAAGK